jgi:uncharacterized RDD family membrane protein YckC
MISRAALYPARAAARAWRSDLEAAADDVVTGPELARVLDRALAGRLPEELARSLVRHQVLERIVRELAASGELDRLLDKAVASDELNRVLAGVASNPELRRALTRQSAGLLAEVVDDLRVAARRVDLEAERAVRHRRTTREVAFAGVGSRAVALAIDALAAAGIFAIVSALFALVASLVGGVRPQWLAGAFLGIGWIVIIGGYFVLFWTTAGQTPGMRVMRLHLYADGGEPLSAGRSAVRVIGLALAIVPFFAGFIPALFDPRRRALPDYLAQTVVVYERAQDGPVV